MTPETAREAYQKQLEDVRASVGQLSRTLRALGYVRLDEFKGWDWTELADKWGIRQQEDDEATSAAIRAHMQVGVTEDGAYNSPEIVADLWAFVGILMECEEGGNGDQDHTHPLWTGLLAIEDDWTFVKYCSVLLEHMWT